MSPGSTWIECVVPTRRKTFATTARVYAYRRAPIGRATAPVRHRGRPNMGATCPCRHARPRATVLLGNFPATKEFE